MSTNVYDILLERGFIEQATNEDEIREMLGKEKVTFYIGFDATADSLTAGHFLTIMAMKHMQNAGHRPIALLGGGTTMIGDPSGKSDMRTMMTKETIDHNAKRFYEQLSRFIDFSDGKAIVENNANWLLDLNYVQMLREIGVHFSVNRMLTAECYKQRMERGLTFFEFNYMIMQSYDFYALYQKYGCNLQFGGDDQWSNMIGGMELIRRKLGKEANAMTITLLTNSEGKKMGKTQKGAVWLDAEKTTPYEFYQYWRNVDDGDVIKCMKLLTFIPMSEINEYAKLEGAELNKAKEALAYSLTELVHGKEEADKAQAAAKALFAGGADDSNMPTTEVEQSELEDGKITVLSLMIKAGMIKSNGEGRRLIQQGGISVNDEKISDVFTSVSADELKDSVIVKKGKKVFHKFTLA